MNGETMDGMAVIEHVGNALCLDFANTVNVRWSPERDWLRTPEELETWSASLGRPVSVPAGPGGGIDAELERMRQVRDALYRVFSPLAAGIDPDRSALDLLARVHAEGARHGTLERASGGFSWSWAGTRTPRVLLWEVAASAVDLLTRGPLDRLGECPSCGWLFLDTSRNRQRRWCSMATCGSRDKAQRYYARNAAARAGS